MPYNYKIGLIGLSQSGKTTFLIGLHHFLRIEEFNGYAYTMSGVDKTSRDWLETLYTSLSSGILPEGTQIKSGLKFRINQIGAPMGVLLPAKNEFYIETTDRQGRDFESKPEQEIDETLIDYLLSCGSYLLLFDLTQDFGTQINCLENVFHNLRDKDKVGLSGKRISVCLTKADHPEVIEKLIKEFNCQKPINLKKIKGRVFLQSYNKNLIFGFIKQLIDFFGHDNIAFFLISSIGFFDDTENKTNLVKMEDGKLMLRNGIDFRPVNLDSPLSWAVGRMTKAELNNEQII